MTPTTKYAYDRLWLLNDHADLQAYGPDLLIQDVQTIVGALASAEREIAELRAQVAAIEASAAFQIGSAVINTKGGD
jgi:hypothetical protein